MSDTSLTPSSAENTANRWAAPNLTSEGKKFSSQTIDERNEQVKNIFQEARDKGYQEGLKEGIQVKKEEINAVLATLQSYQAQLEAPLISIDNSVLRAMLDLSEKIAEKIIRTEITIAPSLLKAQLDEVLANISDKSVDIVVSMHPEDVKIIAKSIDQGGDQSLSEKYQLSIKEDDSLERGDCFVIAPTAVIESKIAEKVGYISEQILLKIEQSMSNNIDLKHD